MPNLLSTFRSLARSFRSSPGFLLVVVLTLAVGIGANAAIFTVVDAVLLRPLPFPEPERLVGIWHRAPGLKIDRMEHSQGTYVTYRRHTRTLADLGIYQEGAVTLTGGDRPERVRMAEMTGSLFSVLRVRPILGRPVLESDGLPGSEKVVVLSEGLWRRRFGGRRDALGASLLIDGVATRVVGVMPGGFRFPAAESELWVPLVIDPAKPLVGNFNYTAIGRLRPGVTPEAVARELSGLVLRMPDELGGEISRGMIESSGLAAFVHPLRDDVVGDIERLLWVLLGSVGIILAIACANVANLFLVRAEGRQREVAVRTALGAGRRQVAGLFLGESVFLGLAGGALGLGLAVAGVRLLVWLRPEGIPRLDEIGVDGRVFLFTAAVSLLAGLLCGGFALLRYGRPALVPTLKEGGRGGTAGRGRMRARNALVVLQVALALVLLVSSGLMAKSFWRMRSVDPGIDPRGVLAVTLSLPESRYPDGAANARFVARLLERVRGLPGVASAGTVNLLPLGGGGSTSAYAIEDFPLPKDAVPPILGTRFVSPGYFEALRIPVIEGRTFDRLDPARPTDEVVVSQALAERFWPGKSALDKRLSAGLGAPTERRFRIVGVVGSVRDQGLDHEPVEAIYFSVRRAQPDLDKPDDWVPRDFSLVVRGKGSPRALADPVRRAVAELDPELALAQVTPMEEVVASSMARTSFTMLLLLIAAAVALLLGTVGIYGVISYVVSQRTREIGVRMALGAARGDISRMVLREGLFITLVGVGLGLAGALVVTRLLVALLFETSPVDPATFAAVPALLAAVALLASWMPARRAASVEPLEAIRYE